MLFGQMNKEIVVINLESSEDEPEIEAERRPARGNHQQSSADAPKCQKNQNSTKRPAEKDHNKEENAKRQRTEESETSEEQAEEDPEMSDEFRIPEDIQLLLPDIQLEDIRPNVIRTVLKPRKDVLRKLKIDACYLNSLPTLLPKIGSYSTNITELVIFLYQNFNISDEDFRNLFTPMQSLLALEIKGIDQRFCCKVLKYLPLGKMKKITLMLKQEVIMKGQYKVITQKALASALKLKSLILKGFEIPKWTIVHIAKMSKLKYLSLTNCFFSMENPFIRFTHLQKLKYLDLSNSKEVSDCFFRKIFQCCPLLNHVNIKKCSALTNTTMKDLSKLKCLEVLLISGLPKITNESLKSLKKLKRLDCDECNKINDVGIITFLYGNSVVLESLNVTNCDIHIETLLVANELAKRHQNGIKLNIFVHHSLKEQWTALNLSSPYLFIW